MGSGMVWPFGGEHWCNLEGRYVHIVSDMRAYEFPQVYYEVSVCMLGIMGTRYVRGQDPAEQQSLLAEIEI